jgi:hypothetical protein
MIWESSYWKEELFWHARRIRRLQTLKRWVERSTAALEKDLMIGFYSIRKMVEAHTVSDEIRDRSLSLQGYPWTGSPVTFMNWDKIDQKYDLEHPVPVTKTGSIRGRESFLRLALADCAEGSPAMQFSFLRRRVYERPVAFLFFRSSSKWGPTADFTGGAGTH